MTKTGGTMTENTRGSFVVGKIENLGNKTSIKDPHKVECQKFFHCTLREPCTRLCEDYVPCINVAEAIGEMNDKIAEHKETPGGSTPSQYQLPDNATDLQDLIEYRDMNFAMGNIFKACYRSGNCSHSDLLRDINKIIWFANRELNRLLDNE